MEEVMDDNNYMNNDNQSSGTPDNTGVFGQSSETANGSDTVSYTHLTVAKECEFVKAYLALQKYRFGERLNYNIDIEADCMECQVPKPVSYTHLCNRQFSTRTILSEYSFCNSLSASGFRDFKRNF